MRTSPNQHCMLAGGGRSLVAALLLIAAAGSAAAQQTSTPPPTAGTPAQAAREQASPSARFAEEKPQAMSSQQALYLVRSTLLTLNDANRSGNYTVLRDLAAPDFQTRNSAADLAQSFADLRRRNFDLFAVALLTPQFVSAPTIDANGRARMTGLFPTRPMQISFDLTFQVVRGQWRLLAISVGTPQALKESPVDQPASRQPSKLFYGVRAFSGSAGLRW